MNRYEGYLDEVMRWEEEVRSALLTENIHEDDKLYIRLNELTEKLTLLKKQEENEEEIVQIQVEVQRLHQEMEEYFAIRGRHVGYVKPGKHQLPPLPYAYNALEPYISEEIMKLHHQKHHQSYVDGLNKAETNLEKARQTGDFSLVKHWSRELAFHGSGHYLHTIFWNNMSPKGGGKPSGILLKEIEKYFGSYESFKKHFSEAAKGVEGVGWAILVWSPRSHHLEILQSERHMILTQWDTIPLLVLDVWEHAYYLQYKNKKAEYVDNWWNLINWKDVEDRFMKARQLKWKPY